VLASGAKSWKRRQRSRQAFQLNSVDWCEDFIPLQLALLRWNASSSPHLDVWSTQRNRLGPDKAEKLVKAYRYLHHDNDEPDW